jgi:hypothetical protein
MTAENPLAIDVATRTTRGRACPRCGGKIIPSDRAVYQNSSDPDAVFPVWQCERCGYEELAARPKSAAKAKAEPAKQVKAPPAVASSTRPSPAQVVARPTAPVVLDPKGRPYPPDVLQLMDRMKQPLRRDG